MLGAFLVLPAMLALQRILTGRLREILAGGLLLALFSLAVLFLTFSRAAWGQFAFCVAPPDAADLRDQPLAERARIRIVWSPIVGGVLMRRGFAWRRCSRSTRSRRCSRSAPASTRATTPATGRFGRHIARRSSLALDTPFGIGPLQFAKFFPEDPHNAYLNAFMSGGWLCGAELPDAHW